MTEKAFKKRRLIVVSNRLPYYQTNTENGKPSWKQATGGLVTALDPVLRKTHGVWIGWQGAPQDDFHKEDFELIDIRSLGISGEISGETGGYYYIANVPLTTKEVYEYYNRFSNGTLWSLFHYFFEKTLIEPSSWESYFTVNNRFANYIHKIIKPSDIIWIQDFHLFLVPYFLRKMRPKQDIHFFLHIPFPHLDIFSILPWKDQIIESLLCCNTVGVHHRQYRRNIIEAVNFYRSQVKGIGEGLDKSNIETKFYVNPISIDFEKFDKTSRKTEVIARKKEIKSQSGCPKLILGVDRLDYSKGIKERLLGIEHLLERHPELKERFSYYQLAVPSRESVEAYQILKKEIDEIIGRINGRFSTGTWSPIHYIYSSVPFNELVAFYAAADIALITPLRDGMNLVCKEYIASHSDGEGVLILSKFAGAISEIKNCLSVNPYGVDDIVNTLYYALHMDGAERRMKMLRMRKNIRSNSINSWLSKCFQMFNQKKEGLYDTESR